MPEQKIKASKDEGYELPFSPNPDILSEIGERREEIEQKTKVPLKLIGFAAETAHGDELVSLAKEKLERKSLYAIVANNAVDAMGEDSSSCWLITRNGLEKEITFCSKYQIADSLIHTISEL